MRVLPPLSHEPRYYEGVETISEFASVKDADLQLHQGNGWEILRIEKLTNDSVDGQGVVKRSERLVFILGRRKPVVGDPAATGSRPATDQPATNRQQPPAAKMKGLSSPCKYCQGPIWWVKEDGKNVPKNENGERHSCR